MKIVSLQRKYFDQVIKFSDINIGTNYFSHQDLEKILELSIKDGLNCSLLSLDDENKISGIRLSYAPGRVFEVEDRIKEIPVKPQELGYFKSLFIGDKYQGQGLGSALSAKSMEILKEMGAKGIMSHSWVQSPGNSSFKYLTKIGFRELREIPNFWTHIDYDCTHCGAGNKCYCSAKEMFREIK